MTRTISTLVVCCAAALLATATVAAQSKDFSGTWVPDAEKSGIGNGGQTAIMLTLTAKTFAVQPVPPSGAAARGNGASPAFTFNLDGTETDLPMGGKGKAVWKGAKLEVTMTQGANSQTMTFSREGEWLVQEGSSAQGTKKIYLKRKPTGGGDR